MPKYLIRLIVVFVLGAAALLVGRGLLVPKSFGQLGHYRAAALGEIASPKTVYAGHEACEACHDDVVAVKSKDRHAALSCEVCHGAAAAHAEDPAAVKPNTNLDRSFCLRCHEKDLTRPAGFPTVEGSTHNVKEDCRKCHTPHAPSPKPKGVAE